MSFNNNDHMPGYVANLHKVSPQQLNGASAAQSLTEFHLKAGEHHTRLAGNASESRIHSFHVGMAQKHLNEVDSLTSSGNFRIPYDGKTTDFEYDNPGFYHYTEN